MKEKKVVGNVGLG